MGIILNFRFSEPRLGFAAGFLCLLMGWSMALMAQDDNPPAEGPKTVRGVMQSRPGGPMEEVEVQVHAAPVDLPSVPAAEASLPDDDLVLGVFVDGAAMAFPVRYLALYEVIDQRVGKTPLAPTW